MLDKYVACKVDALETNCEAIWAKLEVTGSKPLYIASYYRPPDTNTFNIQQLDEALRKIPQPKETLPNVILTGVYLLHQPRSETCAPWMDRSMLEVERTSNVSLALPSTYLVPAPIPIHKLDGLVGGSAP